MTAHDLPLHAVLHGPPVSPRVAAKQLCDRVIGDGRYVVEALHCYTDRAGNPVYWRIRARLPDGSKWIRPMRRVAGRFELGEPAFGEGGKPLYRLHELVTADASAPVWFVEGEVCVDAIARLGLLATTAGGASSDERADFEPLRGRHAIIWPDSDDAGRAHGDRVVSKLRALGCRVELVEVDKLALPDGGDVVDWLAAHPAATADDLARLPRRPVAEEPAAPDGAAVELLRGDAIVMKPVKWLWPGWLARGKLHILAGRAGAGKTTLALSAAAIATTGGRWPDGTRAEPGHVAIWSGEDDAGDTLLPRLAAMGADLRRVHIVGKVRDADGPRPFDPATDVAALRGAMLRLGEPVILCIVDPVVQAVAGDAHRANEVRRSLAPLVELAETVSCALVGISHFAKFSSGQVPTERVIGSQAFGAVARVVLVAAKRDDTAGGNATRVLARAKSNVGSDNGGFEYELEQVPVPGHAGMFATAVRWGAPLVGSARALLAEAESEGADDERSAVEDAFEFLRSVLAGGPVPAKQVRAEADAAGYSWSTVRRAQKRLGVEVEKEGGRFGSGCQRWLWRLPDAPPRLKVFKNAEGAQDPGLGTFNEAERLLQKPDLGDDFEVIE